MSSLTLHCEAQYLYSSDLNNLLAELSVSIFNIQKYKSHNFSDEIILLLTHDLFQTYPDSIDNYSHLEEKELHQSYIDIFRNLPSFKIIIDNISLKYDGWVINYRIKSENLDTHEESNTDLFLSKLFLLKTFNN